MNTFGSDWVFVFESLYSFNQLRVVGQSRTIFDSQIWNLYLGSSEIFIKGSELCNLYIKIGAKELFRYLRFGLVIFYLVSYYYLNLKWPHCRASWKIHFYALAWFRMSDKLPNFKNTSACSPYTAESGVQKAREILEMQKWHKNIPTEYWHMTCLTTN